MNAADERHARAVARARAERTGTDQAMPRSRRTGRLREWVADSPHLRAQRTEDPVGAVKAAQKAYRHLERLGLLDAVTRRVLTRDYEAAVDAAYRAGRKAEVLNASWPPLPDPVPDTVDSEVVEGEVVDP